MESACREKQVCFGIASGFFRRPVRNRRPLKNHLLAVVSYYCGKLLRRNVPITASGPQGEQPLLDMKNAGKGSRQIRPVTLGKGLALVLCRSGCWGVTLISASGVVSASLWHCRRRFLLPSATPTACSKLELQRSKGIRLFN